MKTHTHTNTHTHGYYYSYYAKVINQVPSHDTPNERQILSFLGHERMLALLDAPCNERREFSIAKYDGAQWKINPT